LSPGCRATRLFCTWMASTENSLACTSPSTRREAATSLTPDAGQVEVAYKYRSAEDFGSVLSVLSATSSESTAVCAGRSVVASHGGARLDRCKEEAEDEELEKAADKAGIGGRRAVQQTDIGLDSNPFDRRCADAVVQLTDISSDISRLDRRRADAIVQLMDISSDSSRLDRRRADAVVQLTDISSDISGFDRRRADAVVQLTGISLDSSAVVQLTDVSLDSTRLRRTCADGTVPKEDIDLKSKLFDRTGADASPEELWQTRLGLLADRPFSLPTAVVAQDALSGLGQEELASEVRATSAVSGSCASLLDGVLDEHEKLWHLRLSLYFDRREHVPYHTVSAASFPTRRADCADFDLDMEEYKEDLARWLSPQQLKSLGMQATDLVTADTEKSSPEIKHVCTFACSVTLVVLILVPSLMSIASKM